MKLNAGITNEEKFILESYITPDILEQRKRDYRLVKDRVQERLGNAMQFYDQPISEERKKDIKDWVAMKRKVNPI